MLLAGGVTLAMGHLAYPRVLSTGAKVCQGCSGEIQEITRRAARVTCVMPPARAPGQVKTKVSSWYPTKPSLRPPPMPAILGEDMRSLFSLSPDCFRSSQGGSQPNRLLSKNSPSCGHRECIVNNCVLRETTRLRKFRDGPRSWVGNENLIKAGFCATLAL